MRWDMLHRKQGFSLVELSIVLLILGVMIGGLMSVLAQDARRKKQLELKIKMDAIEKSLSAYVKKNNRLPCPSDGTYGITSAYFGKEATSSTSDTTTCIVGSGNYSSGFRTSNPSPPMANFYTGTTVGGVVPVRSLGLPDDYILDPWGGRFTYIVDMRFTTNDSNALPFIIYPPTASTTTLSSLLRVDDTSGSARTTNAIAVVISHGQNGHGAYQLSGSRRNAGITNSKELENCSCNASAADGTFNTTYVQQQAAASDTDLRNSFDDVVRYYTRASFLSTLDMNSEY